MQKIPPERVKQINEAWLRQDPKTIAPEVQKMFSEFSEKVWKGVPIESRSEILINETKEFIEEKNYFQTLKTRA